MELNSAGLSRLYTGYNALFTKGFGEAGRIYDKIAMKTTSSTSEEIYAWMGQIPQIREWLGDRFIHKMSAYDWTIKNRDFEATISVPRNAIMDDRFGTFGPLFQEFGQRTGEFPDKLLAELIASGFTKPCYDGQYFFDADHPVDTGEAAAGSVSNLQTGAGPAWYLLDLSRALRPFVYQERSAFNLISKDDPQDDNVFMRKEYIYGTDGRCNVGFGLWQLAYASKAELNSENFELVRSAMSRFVGNHGHKLGVKGTHLLVPTELEGDARRLLKSQLLSGGESNPWADSAEIIVSPWL